MAWYDLFSRVYDASLEPHYREQRRLSAAALDLRPGSVVLDLPCGTGQSFPTILEAIGPTGQVIGADLSAGMLRESARRIARAGWTNVTLIEADVNALTPELLASRHLPRPDRVHCFLGMSVFPQHVAAFERLWDVLEPGGRCVLVDVHAERPGLQGRLVEWLAQADLTRRFWAPLERVGSDFEMRELPSKALHGGTIRLATAVKPG